MHPQATATVRTGGRYAHSYENKFEFENINAKFDQSVFVANSRALMDLFYRMLEQEYEYQLSDATIAENIIANEVEFKEDGTAFQ